MAQVVFVGVIREIFAHCIVAAVKMPYETSEMVRKRLEAIADDSQPRTTLQIRKPNDVVLRRVKK